MNDQAKMKAYQEKKRRRLNEPTKTASPNAAQQPQFQIDPQWKKTIEMNASRIGRPSTHSPHMNAINGNESGPGPSGEIQINKPSVIKSNPNVIGSN